MLQLIYVSEAAIPFNDEILTDILKTSRKSNKEKDITGILLFRAKCFMQLLEGPKEEVETLYHKITLDERHKNFIIVSKEDIDSRVYPEWSMGFEQLSDVAKGEDGYIDFFNQTPETDDAVKQLVYSFKSYTENN